MTQKNCIFFIFLLFPAFGPQLFAQEGPADDQKEFEKQYEERIKKDRLFGVYIPKNLDDALSQLNAMVSPESQAKIKAIPEDSVCTRLHSGLGQWMINNWGFYGGSRLSHYLKSAGVTFPDDMADLLILAYHRKLNAVAVDLKGLVAYFKEKRKKEWEKEQAEKKVIKEEKRKKQVSRLQGFRVGRASEI
jgi:hypothetical protein